MLVVRDYRSARNILGRSVVTVGNFDGLHLGHAKIISTTIGIARDIGIPSIMCTFSPHPLVFFSKVESSEFLIHSEKQKIELASACGLDGIILINFDDVFASISANEFVPKVLVNEIGASCIIVGSDFKFGKNRVGDAKLLQSVGAKLGVDVILVEVSNNKLSSSTVRSALLNGDVEYVGSILGRYFTLQGTVVLSGFWRLEGLEFHYRIQADTIKPATGLYMVNTIINGATTKNTLCYVDNQKLIYLDNANRLSTKSTIDISFVSKARVSCRTL